MRQHLRVLVLEDVPADAELIVAELQSGGYECEWRRVDDEPSFTTALGPDVDLILADYSVPNYSAVRALSELKRRALDIPFIVITGAPGEEKAVDCLRLGATDYLLKDRLARLSDAVARALEDRRARDERKEAERAAQLAAQVLERVASLVLVADQNGDIVYASPSVERLLGFSREEVLGDGWWRLSRTHATDAAVERERLAAAARDVTRVSAGVYERKIIDRTGQVHWFAWEEGPGPGNTIVGVGHDISDQTRAETLLREREEHFRSLIENALDIIAVIDPKGMVTYVSPSVETVLGYAESDIVGRRALDWLHPDDVAGVVRTLPAIIDGTARQRVLTVRGRHADGSWRSLEMMVKARRDEQRLHFIINARDISDRESLEEQLRQSQKMEAIGRLAGGIAHDFNNLLTAILGYAELMLDRLPETSDLRVDIAEIIKAGDRAGALTRQLLAFSRKQVLQPQRLNLNTVITDFEKMLGRVIGEDVTLVTRLSAALGVVHADRGQIEQVLMNMAVNARDAMPRGGTLSIETSVATFDEPFTDRQVRLDPGRWVCLTVSDTGAGMPADVAARVFEPFFTTKAPGKGTGLGLSTVYGIVAQSGGHIALESVAGTGTTFRVYLPEISRTASDEFKFEVAADRTGGTETILLVEDELGIRKLIRKALERQGYTVLEAATGEQAVAMAKRHTGSIDLLLSDIVMPGMTGVDVAQHLVAERPQLKVMHISGFAVAAHVGKLSPNVSFLQKPFTVDALARQVRQCLDNAAGGGTPRK